MPSQVAYQTNADLNGSHEALVNNSLVKVKADMTQKGLLWFQFKDSQTVFCYLPWENYMLNGMMNMRRKYFTDSLRTY